MAGWTSISDNDLPGADQIRAFELNGQHIAIARVGIKLYAFAGDCTHDGCPLGEGYLEGTLIECICHGARFDLATGAVVKGPAVEPVRIYPVREIEGQIEVDLA